MTSPAADTWFRRAASGTCRAPANRRMPSPNPGASKCSRPVPVAGRDEHAVVGRRGRTGRRSRGASRRTRAARRGRARGRIRRTPPPGSSTSVWVNVETTASKAPSAKGSEAASAWTSASATLAGARLGDPELVGGEVGTGGRPSGVRRARRRAARRRSRRRGSGPARGRAGAAPRRRPPPRSSPPPGAPTRCRTSRQGRRSAPGSRSRDSTGGREHRLDEPRDVVRVGLGHRLDPRLPQAALVTGPIETARRPREVIAHPSARARFGDGRRRRERDQIGAEHGLGVDRLGHGPVECAAPSTSAPPAASPSGTTSRAPSAAATSTRLPRDLAELRRAAPRRPPAREPRRRRCRAPRSASAVARPIAATVTPASARTSAGQEPLDAVGAGQDEDVERSPGRAARTGAARSGSPAPPRRRRRAPPAGQRRPLACARARVTTHPPPVQRPALEPGELLAQERDRRRPP